MSPFERYLNTKTNINILRKCKKRRKIFPEEFAMSYLKLPFFLKEKPLSSLLFFLSKRRTEKSFHSLFSKYGDIETL